MVRFVALAIRSAFEASEVPSSLTTALSASGSLILTAAMIVVRRLRRHMVIEQLLNLRLEFLEIDDFLVAELYRPFQLAELLPFLLEGLDLVLVENVVELFRRQRDMQAPAEGAQARIEILPLGFVGKKLLELLHVLLVADCLEQVPKLIVELRQLCGFPPGCRAAHRQRSLSRDNLDENGGGNQSLKRRPVAKA